MMWGDAELKFDNELNCEYLEHHERATKTRTGANIRDIRSCPPRMYATPDYPERCPVEIYKLYESKRPDDYCLPTDPFYIATITNNTTPGLDQKWFLRGPIGINKIKEMMRKMAKNAELPQDKKLTNTSVRKTLVQRMTDCNVPDNLQVYVTGHKRPESLNNYRQLGNSHKKQISHLLTHNTAKPQPQATLSAPPPNYTSEYLPRPGPVPALHYLPTAQTQATLPAPPPNATSGYLHQAQPLPAPALNYLPISGPSNTVTSNNQLPYQGQRNWPVDVPSTTSDSLILSQTAPSQMTQSNTRSSLESVFAGTTIHGNVYVNFNNNYGTKRRRIRVIESDSDGSQ